MPSAVESSSGFFPHGEQTASCNRLQQTKGRRDASAIYAGHDFRRSAQDWALVGAAKASSGPDGAPARYLRGQQGPSRALASKGAGRGNGRPCHGTERDHTVAEWRRSVWLEETRSVAWPVPRREPDTLPTWPNGNVPKRVGRRPARAEPTEAIVARCDRTRHVSFQLLALGEHVR